MNGRFALLITALGFLACEKAKEYRVAMQEDSTRMSLQTGNPMSSNADESQNRQENRIDYLDTATFGMGCFWCTEALFEQVRGIVDVQSGYSGGSNKYIDLSNIAKSGHTEVINISYDTTLIGYKDLLEMFWSSHDPTTLNRQGDDVGAQYRSVIYYHSPSQRALAESYKHHLSTSELWPDPIVTSIEPFGFFVNADADQQNFFSRNPDKQYCRLVIQPKIEKFRKVFSSDIRMKSE